MGSDNCALESTAWRVQFWCLCVISTALVTHWEVRSGLFSMWWCKMLSALTWGTLHVSYGFSGAWAILNRCCGLLFWWMPTKVHISCKMTTDRQAIQWDHQSTSHMQHSSPNWIVWCWSPWHNIWYRISDLPCEHCHPDSCVVGCPLWAEGPWVGHVRAVGQPL